MSQQVTLVQVPTSNAKSSKCGCCGEYIKVMEPRFQLRNAKNRSEGTYCSRCNDAGSPALDAELNDWIIVDEQSNDNSHERMAEHFMECRAAGVPMETAWDDWNYINGR